MTLKQKVLNAHSFRHIHATKLIENGAAPKAVAVRLGHSNTNIIQNLYTHNTRKMQENVSVVFEKTLPTTGRDIVGFFILTVNILTNIKTNFDIKSSAA